jgi:hypothetical protein
VEAAEAGQDAAQARLAALVPRVLAAALAGRPAKLEPLAEAVEVAAVPLRDEMPGRPCRRRARLPKS